MSSSLDRSPRSLLLGRWHTGPGPIKSSRAIALYQSLDGEGLMLDYGGGDAPDGIEQASLYRHWQGRVPGPGYLDGTAPLSLFAVDVQPAATAAWDAYYRNEHFPAVLSLPGYAGGTRFRLERRLLEGLGRDPEWLTIYQLEDEAALERLSRPDLQTPAAAETYADWVRRGAPHTSNLLQRRYRRVAPWASMGPKR